MDIRDARPHDAGMACVVIRQSITKLCFADHRNDPIILADWLANKTADHVLSWISAPHNSVLVACDKDTIIGVGAVMDDGTITLNYVAPNMRFCGVSKAMLRALEMRAIARGAKMCALQSTKTALGFYLAHGYAKIAENTQKENVLEKRFG